jgi:hypothetical protein
MDALLAANQTVMAVGNMRVNAAGDVLGDHGEITQKNEDRVRAYYKNNPTSSTATASLKGKLPGASDDEITDARSAAPKTSDTERENKRTMNKARRPMPVAEPDQPEPSEFDAPEVEPLGHKEVELPNGDIEMVPIYKKSEL